MSLLTILILVLVLCIVVLVVTPLRQALVSGLAMKLMKSALPAIGDTEQIALQAGTTWWEKDLFSGSPDWRKLLDFKVKGLSPEEQAYLDGPVNELCAMLDDEAIAQSREIPEPVWAFIKQHKFLGMVIARDYGGLGFSAAGHAIVISRISSVSIPVAITVMVPNSLGPGELLHYYGTPEQKQHYLPRLATGEEIPCFALTEPHAGSDAAAGRSHGVVCRGEHEGRDVLGIRLTFNKRYITLAPIASVIGLAFNLRDPDHLIGDKTDIGITCALLPRSTKGLNVGDRHDPMGIPFHNGPVSGEDVFIPMDYVIGGQDYAGQGWRMLMECLSIGRSISLPSLSIGGAQLATRAMSAYASIREQFGIPIQKFEGIREPLVRIFAASYWMSAARDVTCGAIDAGEKPSVVSAIVKHYLTEELRRVVNDAMDIQGGAAISRGDRNILGRTYTSIPIAITVEGANILTRSLIVFGQGAMRCHPFLLAELAAIAGNDRLAFDKALSGHVLHVIKNQGRSFFHALTGSRFASAPDGKKGRERRHYQHLSRLSAAFAYAADMGLLTLGGNLKRSEYLSGRYADALAWLYLASTTLKRYHDEADEKTWPLVHYTLTHAEHQVQKALDGIIGNFPNRLFGYWMRLMMFPLGCRFRPVTDRQVEAVVNTVLEPQNALRDKLSTNIFLPAGNVPGLGRLEAAYQLALAGAPARGKITRAVREGKIGKDLLLPMAEQAREQGIITAQEYEQVRDAEHAMDDVIQVNFFDPETYKTRK